MARDDGNPKGLTVRQLTLIFFGLVSLSAVFFALGFLVGAHRRAAAATPTVQNVPPPGEIPTPVNTPPPGPEEDTGAATPESSTQAASVIEENLNAAGPAPSQAPAAAAAPSTPAIASYAPSAPPGIMVQVAALRNRQDAQSLLRVLKSRGYRAVLVTPQEARSADHLYRVQVGPFARRAAAMETFHKLSRQGFRPYLRK